MKTLLRSKGMQRADPGLASPQKRPIKGGISVTVDGNPVAFTQTALASELAVRDTLLAIHSQLSAHGVSSDTCGSVELVMAEALNNIVEHGCAKDQPHDIRLSMAIKPGRLRFQIIDGGAPLPGLSLPKGRLPEHSGSRDELPEGGFGWFLIRDLTERVTYERRGGVNHLTLEFLRSPP